MSGFEDRTSNRRGDRRKLDVEPLTQASPLAKFGRHSPRKEVSQVSRLMSLLALLPRSHPDGSPMHDLPSRSSRNLPKI